MSLKRLHETQLSIVVKLDRLQELLNEFNKLTGKLVDENHAIAVIHKDLTKIIRVMSGFMSEVPNLMNTLVNMLTEERMSFEIYSKDIANIKDMLDDIHTFVFAKKDKDGVTLGDKEDDGNN